MELLQLDCRWRGPEITPGKFACASPKLRVSRAGVSVETCAACHCRDHEPVAALAKAPARKRPANRPALECVHRGAELRTEQCKSCGGKVLVRVFACDVHTECTLAKALPETKTCAGCADRQAPPPVQPPSGLPPVDVVTLMSGRWYAWEHWLASLTGLDYPREKLRLFAYTNSDDAIFVSRASQEMLKLNQQGFAARLVIDTTLKVSRNALRELQPGDGFPKDHGEVIAELYNRACEFTTNDLFFLEDDMGVQPDSLLRLQAACSGGAGYAVAVVKDRHGPDTFCWDLQRKETGEYTAVQNLHPDGVHPIGLGGFACTYIPRWSFAALSAPKFKCYAPAEWKPGPIAGSDMILCMEMDRLGIVRVCDFGLPTKHYDSQGRAH